MFYLKQFYQPWSRYKTDNLMVCKLKHIETYSFTNATLIIILILIIELSRTSRLEWYHGLSEI